MQSVSLLASPRELFAVCRDAVVSSLCLANGLGRVRPRPFLLPSFSGSKVSSLIPFQHGTVLNPFLDRHNFRGTGEDPLFF